MDKLWDKNKCDFRRKTYSGISQIWIQAKEGRRPTTWQGEILINDPSVSLRRVHAHKDTWKKKSKLRRNNSLVSFIYSINSDTIIDTCVGFHGMFCQESGSSQECIFEIDTFEPNTLTKPANRQFNKKLNLTFIRSTKQIAVLVRKNYAESNNMPNCIWTRIFQTNHARLRKKASRTTEMF